MLVPALGIRLVAVSVPVSFASAALGLYSTVTLHGSCGSTLFPVQVSAVFVNADPDRLIASPDNLPLALVSVNVFATLLPTVTVP
jgi:hypothetical protein